MDIAELRDLIIIIYGILGIILLLALGILALVVYVKINRLIKKAKEIVEKTGQSLTSPYYTIASALFRGLAKIFGAFSGDRKRRGQGR